MMGVALLLLVIAWDVGFALHAGFGVGGTFVLATVGVAVVLAGGAASEPAFYIRGRKLHPGRMWPAHLGLLAAAALPFVSAAALR